MRSRIEINSAGQAVLYLQLTHERCEVQVDARNIWLYSPTADELEHLAAECSRAASALRKRADGM